MSARRRFMYEFSAVGALTCLFALAALAQPSVGVNVMYAVRDITLNEPAILEFSVDNRLPESAFVDLGTYLFPELGMELTRPDGRIAIPKRPYDGMDVPLVESIPASGTYSKRLLLNKWFAFDMPGRYVLAVKLKKPIRVNGVVAPYPVSARVSFSVAARDPDRLAKACEGLQRKALQEKNAYAGEELAEILSYVADPVAVPYLKAMLDNSRTAPYAIDGLMRVGDASAVEALIAQSDNPDREIGRRAVSSLARIAATTQDTALKQKARDVLDRVQASPGRPDNAREK
jgi:hypothetical protein